MATVYRAPIDYQADYTKDWQETERAYLIKLKALAQNNDPTDALAGEIIRWQRGDGYAEYMIWTSKPLSLVHLEIGDAWSVEEPLIRGLKLKDVKEMIAREKRLRELFSIDDVR